MGIFTTEVERWSTPIKQAQLRSYSSLPTLGNSRDLFETVFPRGALLARQTADRERMNYFMAPGALMARHRYEQGQLIIGKLGTTPLGHLDDRPMIITAAARSGKSSTTQLPNLYTYPGSMLVLDPKGELSQTARHRRAMGHIVQVVDAFGQSGEPSACFNCLEELDPDDLAVVDQVMSIVNALVPDSGGGGNAKFFNDSARTLLVAIILFVLVLRDKSERNLVTVRQLVTLSYPPLVEAAETEAARIMSRSKVRGKETYVDANTIALKVLFGLIIKLGNRFGGIAASIGRRFLNTPPVELGGVVSTASVHTDFIDSLPLRRIIRHSTFRLTDLRSERPTTIFLVLPVGELERQYRFLRLIVQLACSKLERLGTYPAYATAHSIYDGRIRRVGSHAHYGKGRGLHARF